jgi:serine/threonine-protein kinase
MSFLAELRKRKVFQVALGYLAVAWLLVQVTATILPAFELPAWALRFVVLLFALGFPIAVLMAWALELTPEGVKLDVETPGGKRMLGIAVVLTAAALGWFFRGHLSPARPVAQPVAVAAAAAAPVHPAVDERSIAVLPLVNASNDPNQQFFSDGLSENLIDTLSRFDGLKVIGRTSAFQFRNSKDDSATIGSKLGVTYLLSGSVQRAVGVVRISASLIKAADGSTRPWKNHPSATAMSTTATASMPLPADVLTSSFRPSGVSSSDQAISRAMGKPRANSSTTRRSAHTGRSNAGRMVAVTCTSSQATAR